jgi:transmembrane sensor
MAETRDLPPGLGRALGEVTPVWDDARASSARAGIVRKRKRRKTMRTGAAAAVFALAGAGAGFLAKGSGEDAPSAVRGAGAGPLVDHAAQAPAQALTATAGAGDPIVTPAGGPGEAPAGSPWPLPVIVAESGEPPKIVADDGAQVGVALGLGRARFRVARAEHRRELRVAAGAVVVAGWDAEFAVDRYENGVEILVRSGRVLVASGGAERELGPGERMTVAAGRPSKERVGAAAPAASRTDWKVLARAGDADAAWAALGGQAPDSDLVEDLLLFADIARASGHAAAAVAPLGRVATDHGKDARAPAAAFTLGRIHLESLSQPAQAASWFERARSLAPDGPLVEDALAREAEAWARAGAGARARAAAARYLERFPAGHRAEAMRKLLP